MLEFNKIHIQLYQKINRIKHVLAILSTAFCKKKSFRITGSSKICENRLLFFIIKFEMLVDESKIRSFETGIDNSQKHTYSDKCKI